MYGSSISNVKQPETSTLRKRVSSTTPQSNESAEGAIGDSMRRGRARAARSTYATGSRATPLERGRCGLRDLEFEAGKLTIVNVVCDRVPLGTAAFGCC